MLSCQWDGAYKRSLAVAHVVAAVGFLLLSESSFTICSTLYNCKYNVLSASLNKTFPSLLDVTNITLYFSLPNFFSW